MKQQRIVWFRSWHWLCSCFWDHIPGVVIGETRLYYLVETYAHETRKIAKWRVIEQASNADA